MESACAVMALGASLASQKLKSCRLSDVTIVAVVSTDCVTTIHAFAMPNTGVQLVRISTAHPTALVTASAMDPKELVFVMKGGMITTARFHQDVHTTAQTMGSVISSCAIVLRDGVVSDANSLSVSIIARIPSVFALLLVFATVLPDSLNSIVPSKIALIAPLMASAKTSSRPCQSQAYGLNLQLCVPASLDGQVSTVRYHG